MSQFISKYKNATEWCSFLLYALTLFTLPFPWHITQPIIVVWVVMWLFEGRWLKRPKWHNSIIPQLFLIALLVFEALSLFWNDNHSAVIHEINIHLPFIYVLILSLWGLNDKYNADILKTTLIVGCLLSAIFYIGFNAYVINHNIEQYLSPTTNRNIFDLGDGPTMSIKHRQDYSITLLLAIAFCPSLFNLLNDRLRCKHKRTIAYCVSIITGVLLTTVILLSRARIALFILPVILILMLFKNCRTPHTRRIATIGTVLIVCATIATLAFHPRMKRLYHDITTIEQGIKIDRESPQDPRWHIWKTIYDYRHEYGLTGLGIGNEQSFLIEKYNEEGFLEEAYQGYSAHNQYLHEWITLGPIATVLLILAFGLMPFMPPKGHRYTAAVVAIIYAVCMLTDIPLSFIGTLYILYSALILIESERSAYEQNVHAD